MSAYVMEAVDVSLAILGQDELEASYLIFEPVSRFAKADLVGDELPFSGEDGTSLKLVHFLGCIPRVW